jgi:hypothetical protein
MFLLSSSFILYKNICFAFMKAEHKIIYVTGWLTEVKSISVRSRFLWTCDWVRICWNWRLFILRLRKNFWVIWGGINSISVCYSIWKLSFSAMLVYSVKDFLVGQRDCWLTSQFSQMLLLDYLAVPLMLGWLVCIYMPVGMKSHVANLLYLIIVII